jgi:cytoskeletal protein RodZ
MRPFHRKTSRHARRGSFKMGIIKSMHIALLGALLLGAGSVSARAQAAAQPTGDQDQTDTSAAKKDKKSEKADAGASAAQSAPDSGTAPSKKKTTPKQADATDKGATAASASAPASKTSTTRQEPPANGAGMVWVNTDSGIYHKPGTHWYGKTKKGKYMTEADAIKAGYHPAKKE